MVAASASDKNITKITENNRKPGATSLISCFLGWVGFSMLPRTFQAIFEANLALPGRSKS